MSNVLAILQRVLVNYFYRINTGFFLLVFFIMFGIPVNVAEFHLSLADGIIKNPSFLAVVMLVWFLYNGRCIDYVVKQLRHPQQQFLYCLHNVPYIRCYTYLLFVQLMVYVPVLLYAGFIVVVAVRGQYFISAAEVILFNAAIVCVTPVIYTRVLQRQQFAHITLPSLKTRLAKPLFSLPLYHTWHNRKQMLFMSKLFSLFLLYIFIKLYHPDHYDIRPVLLCFMVAAAANSALLLEMKDFEDWFLQMQRNFPFTVTRRAGKSLLAIIVLLLPELLFVWKGYPLYFSVSDYAQIFLVGVGFLSLCYALLFTGDTTMEAFMRMVFAILIVLFFIILYNPGILLGMALLALAFGLYASYYYDFEREE
ncbi:MAG TPA: hypothetical protein VG738_17915 [Chitinophagaceae bacterium]|nr:hypothetical protein [Chitinophagaceae bacterium]